MMAPQQLYWHSISSYQRRPKTDSIVIHCSDTTAGHDVSMLEIRTWHIRERKWMDTGYHFLIRRDGSLEVGRPWWAVGAGVLGWNSDSIHVCMAGGAKYVEGKKYEDNNFTSSEFRTLRSLIITLREMDPGAEKVLGHRDYPGVDKYCPSFDVAAWLKKVGLAQTA